MSNDCLHPVQTRVLNKRPLLIQTRTIWHPDRCSEKSTLLAKKAPNKINRKENKYVP